MNKKSNKKLMAGLIVLITLIIIGITCSGFLDNFKEGIKFLGISFGISAGLVLLLFIMKYIIKGADKLLGEGRTFNDRAIVLFSILILVSLTCRGFLKNFTLGIVFLIVSIAFVAITFLIMYGINSKKGAIKKAILAEKTSGEKMFILLTVLILVSLTCGGFIQNLKAGILFLIISIISSLALYLTVTEVKNENSIIGKIIRIETTFNQKMIILLSTIIMVSLTCGGFLRNLKAGIVFLMISIVFTTSMLMLVLGVKSKHKIYDKIAGFETTFNEKMIILLTTMAMVSITSGGFLYNFKLGMLFLTISLIFSSLVLAGVISVRPRVNIFKMRARIQNLGKKEAVRAFIMIFACVFIVFNVGGTWAYFTSGTDSEPQIKTDGDSFIINYNGGVSVDLENLKFDDSNELSLKISTDKASPQMINSSILITAMASGGSESYSSYKISIIDSSNTEIFSSNSSSSTWTPVSAGEYTIKAQVTDSNNTTVTSSKKFTIKNPSELTASSITTTPSGSQTIGENVGIELSEATGGTGGYSYKVEISGAETKTLQEYSSNRTLTWTPISVGSYTIKVTTKDSSGNTAESTSNYTINNKTLVAASITTSPSGSQTAGQEVQITLSGASGGSGGYTYKLEINDGTTPTDFSTSQTYTWTPTSPGTYTITATTKDSSENTATSTAIYSINSKQKYIKMNIDGTEYTITDIYDVYLASSWSNDNENNKPYCYMYSEDLKNGEFPGLSMNYIGKYGTRYLYGYKIENWCNSGVPISSTDKVSLIFVSNNKSSRYPGDGVAGMVFDRTSDAVLFKSGDNSLTKLTIEQ